MGAVVDVGGETRVDVVHVLGHAQFGIAAALVPPPRTHRHRYFGVLAPNASLRAVVTAMAQAGPAQVTPVQSAQATGAATDAAGASTAVPTNPQDPEPAKRFDILCYFLGLISFFAAHQPPSLGGFARLAGAAALGSVTAYLAHTLQGRWMKARR